MPKPDLPSCDTIAAASLLHIINNAGNTLIMRVGFPAARSIQSHLQHQAADDGRDIYILERLAPDFIETYSAPIFE
jgi:hypothetical protein